MTLAPYETRAPKKPEVVAYESLRQIEIFGDFAHRPWRRKAEQEDPQPGRIAGQTKRFRKIGKL